MPGFVSILAHKLTFGPMLLRKRGREKQKKEIIIEVIQALKGKSSGDFL
jgi:hypothetical protein